MPSNTPIPNPQDPRKGDRVMAKDIATLNQAVKRLSKRNYPEPFSPFYNKPLRFEVTLGKNDDGFFVTVAEGYLCERNLAKGEDEDAILYHVPDNRLDDEGFPTKFTITNGQAIFLKVIEHANGGVLGGDDMVLVIDDKDVVSTNYMAGIQGSLYYYKLAVFEDFKLKPFLAGSNIFHETGLSADFVLRDCPIVDGTEVVPGEQLVRLTFTSGRLVSQGKSEEELAYHENLETTNVSYCT